MITFIRNVCRILKEKNKNIMQYSLQQLKIIIYKSIDKQFVKTIYDLINDLVVGLYISAHLHAEYILHRSIYYTNVYEIVIFRSLKKLSL